jgi:hypothetical protein
MPDGSFPTSVIIKQNISRFHHDPFWHLHDPFRAALQCNADYILDRNKDINVSIEVSMGAFPDIDIWACLALKTEYL